MISKKKADAIFAKVRTEWVKRFGEKKLNKKTLELVNELIRTLPDEDGLKRVENLETGKVHLVPVEDIILNGLKGDDLYKYPVEESDKNVK